MLRVRFGLVYSEYQPEALARAGGSGRTNFESITLQFANGHLTVALVDFDPQPLGTDSLGGGQIVHNRWPIYRASSSAVVLATGKSLQSPRGKSQRRSANVASTLVSSARTRIVGCSVGSNT